MPVKEQAKHTSGPWRNTEEYDRDLAGNSTTTIEADKFVAIVYGESRERCEANARLIAAAPEMLEALKDLVRLIQTCKDLYDYDWTKWLIDRKPYSRATRAIAEAEGCQ